MSGGGAGAGAGAGFNRVGALKSIQDLHGLYQKLKRDEAGEICWLGQGSMHVQQMLTALKSFSEALCWGQTKKPASLTKDQCAFLTRCIAEGQPSPIQVLVWLLKIREMTSDGDDDAIENTIEGWTTTVDECVDLIAAYLNNGYGTSGRIGNDLLDAVETLHGEGAVNESEFAFIYFLVRLSGNARFCQSLLNLGAPLTIIGDILKAVDELFLADALTTVGNILNIGKDAIQKLLNHSEGQIVRDLAHILIVQDNPFAGSEETEKWRKAALNLLIKIAETHQDVVTSSLVGVENASARTVLIQNLAPDSTLRVALMAAEAAAEHAVAGGGGGGGGSGGGGGGGEKRARDKEGGEEEERVKKEPRPAAAADAAAPAPAPLAVVFVVPSAAAAPGVLPSGAGFK